MSDPRRDPSDRPSRATGERLVSARAQLESIAPLPSVPPVERRSDPGMVLEFMHQLHSSDRTVSAALYSDVQAAISAVSDLTEEVDSIKVHVLKLAGKVERIEERVTTITNAQIVQGSQIVALDSKVGEMQAVWEGALNNFHHRMSLVERRMDSIEKRFATFQELVVADIDARRKEQSGKASEPPDDATGDAGGPTTVRPRK